VVAADVELLMKPWDDLLDGSDLLRVLIQRPSWQSDAACRGRRPPRWYPSSGEDFEPARAVCRGCAVRVECLEFALGLPEAADEGVWGGTSRPQRARARARGLTADELLAELGS
jgi:WhiB family redox-sensing transcriptional regulator